MAQKAVANPDINFLAVDIKSDILGHSQAQYQLQQERPVVLHILPMTSSAFAGSEQEEDVVDRIYILLQPMAKRKAQKKRLTYPRQLFSYQEF